MHQLVLLTALTATSGLFGGHKSTGHCGRPSMTRHHAYAAPVSTCSTGSCYSAPATHYAPAMSYPAPQAVPAAPAMPAPPVPPKTSAAPAMAPAPYYVQSYYYAPTSPCANGQCYRR